VSPSAIAFVVIFLALGCLVGWYSQKTTAAHADVKVAKTRLSVGRRTRWRSGALVLVLLVVLVLALKDVLIHVH
jgi:uncharacterized membrane protein